jgi:hypothetical protein
MTTFSEKNLDFYTILEESEQFFILFFKENGKSEAVFQHFFYCKTDNLSCLNKKKCLVNSKVKECVFMSSA